MFPAGLIRTKPSPPPQIDKAVLGHMPVFTGQLQGTWKHNWGYNIFLVHLNGKHTCISNSVTVVRESIHSSCVARTPKKVRTSKGDCWIKQWFSSIAPLFEMRTSLKGQHWGSPWHLLAPISYNCYTNTFTLIPSDDDKIRPTYTQSCVRNDQIN